MRAGLIGIGAMGRGHLSNFVRFNEEGNLIKLVAVCDIDESRFGKKDGTLNISGIDGGGFDFSRFSCYTDVDEMLEKEELDFVSIIIPTYLHHDIAIKCLDAGLHVFCEKPMALTSSRLRRNDRSGKEERTQTYDRSVPALLGRI